jgi:hypothetical protein
MRSNSTEVFIPDINFSDPILQSHRLSPEGVYRRARAIEKSWNFTHDRSGSPICQRPGFAVVGQRMVITAPKAGNPNANHVDGQRTELMAWLRAQEKAIESRL